MYDINETGLRKKWGMTAVDFGWKMFANEQKEVKPLPRLYFSLSNLRIATGPLYLGHIIAILILYMEITLNL